MELGTKQVLTLAGIGGTALLGFREVDVTTGVLGLRVVDRRSTAHLFLAVRLKKGDARIQTPKLLAFQPWSSFIGEGWGAPPPRPLEKSPSGPPQFQDSGGPGPQWPGG